MKIGIIGLGRLGKIHARCISNTPFELIGYFDPYVEHNSYPRFETPESLISQTDALIIATPTEMHFDYAKMAITQGKHVFVEKPLSQEITEANSLESLARRHDVINQVGFVERYNPVYRAIKNEIVDPKFIEIHRLSPYSNRSVDISVVMDLMIHDLDLVLDMIPYPCTQIHANGINLFTSHLDLVNARLNFSDKCVVNLTASRASLKTMRKFRVFSPNGYLSMDFKNMNYEHVKISEESNSTLWVDTPSGKKYIEVKMEKDLSGNAIEDELQDFYHSIQHSTPAEANFAKALDSLQLAKQIEDISAASINKS